MKVQLELTLAEAEALYRNAAELPMHDPEEYIKTRGRRAYAVACDALDKLHRATRCFVFHQQVKSGRDVHGAPSLGVQETGDGKLELFNCPACGSTISRRVRP